LKGSDLGAAQKAFSGLPGAAATLNGSSPLAQIGQALQVGNLAGAQKAAEAWQATRSSHHHHPHTQTAAAAGTTTADAAGATGTGTSSIHLTA
jgi:hypothetical protein